MSREDIHLLEDIDRPGGWLVESGGLAQSYVDLHHPTHLEFGYVRAIGAVLDALPAGPLRVIHVGGAAATVARYVAATRTGSVQVVLETDTVLTELVREHLPLPAGVEIEGVDGRGGLAERADGSADVVVVDAFAEGCVPPELTTAELFAEAGRVLVDGGVLIHNVVDEQGGAYVPRVLATALATGRPVLAAGDPAVLLGRRRGNVVVVTGPVDAAALTTALEALDPVQSVLDGEALTDHVGDAAVLADADPQASPPVVRD